MASTHRFQIDFTKDELESLDRLGKLAALRTKREVVTNALTLFKWAAKEVLLGRIICSLDETTQTVKQLELPALTAIYEAGQATPSPAQLEARLKEPTRLFADFAADKKRRKKQ